MSDDLTSVIDLANEYGKRKQSIFKILKRLGIEPKKLPGTNNRGQVISYLTNEEARLVVHELLSGNARLEEENSESLPETLLAEQGVFYLLLLEPDHDPGRFKVGFATSLPERLRQLRCSAPLTKVLRTWPCKRLWEKTAIECIGNGCARLHTEIFRTTSLESVLAKCDRFFQLMPSLPGKVVPDEFAVVAQQVHQLGQPKAPLRSPKEPHATSGRSLSQSPARQADCSHTCCFWKRKEDICLKLGRHKKPADDEEEEPRVHGNLRAC